MSRTAPQLRLMAGQPDAAVKHYRAAAERTTSIPERHYLMEKAARLAVRPAS